MNIRIEILEHAFEFASPEFKRPSESSVRIIIEPWSFGAWVQKGDVKEAKKLIEAISLEFRQALTSAFERDLKIKIRKKETTK